MFHYQDINICIDDKLMCLFVHFNEDHFQNTFRLTCKECEIDGKPIILPLWCHIRDIGYFHYLCSSARVFRIFLSHCFDTCNKLVYNKQQWRPHVGHIRTRTQHAEPIVLKILKLTHKKWAKLHPQSTACITKVVIIIIRATW